MTVYLYSDIRHQYSRVDICSCNHRQCSCNPPTNHIQSHCPDTHRYLNRHHYHHYHFIRYIVHLCCFQKGSTSVCTLCLKKFRTPVIFSNNSNKSGPILIGFGRQNRQCMVTLQVYNWFPRLIKQRTSLGCFYSKISNHL